MEENCEMSYSEHTENLTLFYQKCIKDGDHNYSVFDFLRVRDFKGAKLKLDNLLFISCGYFLFALLFLLCSQAKGAEGFPTHATTHDCDWSGSGSSEGWVQTVDLRCLEGKITWTKAMGGLRIRFDNPIVSSSQPDSFRLCISGKGRNYRVFLEQESPGRRLLPFLKGDERTAEEGNCYFINATPALIVESTGKVKSSDDSSSDPQEDLDSSRVTLSYQIVKSRGIAPDAECRPCTESEILHNYCSADVVARGELLSVRPLAGSRKTDILHVRSTAVFHQTQDVFSPYSSVTSFLDSPLRSFNPDTPKKAKSKKGYLGAVLSHPSHCNAQNGSGEFLWLAQLSLGKPKIICVVYWHSWVKMAKKATAEGTAQCPLIF